MSFSRCCRNGHAARVDSLWVVYTVYSDPGWWFCFKCVYYLSAPCFSNCESTTDLFALTLRTARWQNCFFLLPAWDCYDGVEHLTLVWHLAHVLSEESQSTDCVTQLIFPAPCKVYVGTSTATRVIQLSRGPSCASRYRTECSFCRMFVGL